MSCKAVTTGTTRVGKQGLRLRGAARFHEQSKEENDEVDDEDLQLDRVDVSLESVLWTLERLWELRGLGVVPMSTWIEDEEKRWMKEHGLMVERLDLNEDRNVDCLK